MSSPAQGGTRDTKQPSIHPAVPDICAICNRSTAVDGEVKVFTAAEEIAAIILSVSMTSSIRLEARDVTSPRPPSPPTLPGRQFVLNLPLRITHSR
jgi:hypothetical protein